METIKNIQDTIKQNELLKEAKKVFEVSYKTELNLPERAQLSLINDSFVSIDTINIKDVSTVLNNFKEAENNPRNKKQ